MNVRDVEKIIDDAHKGHEIFKMNRVQAMYSILSTFEYTCNSAMMASVLNPFALKSITDLMDALNYFLQILLIRFFISYVTMNTKLRCPKMFRLHIKK